MLTNGSVCFLIEDTFKGAKQCFIIERIIKSWVHSFSKKKFTHLVIICDNISKRHGEGLVIKEARRCTPAPVAKPKLAA